MRKLILVSVFCVVLFACGKKSDPKPPEETAPGPVKYLTLNPDADSVTLTWEGPEGASDDTEEDRTAPVQFVVKKRIVSEDRSMLGEAKILAEIPLNQDPQNTAYSYHDTSVQMGTTYDYAVTAINGEGSEGDQGRIIRIKFIGDNSIIDYLETTLR